MNVYRLTPFAALTRWRRVFEESNVVRRAGHDAHGEGRKFALTVLSDVEIEKRIKNGSLILSPYEPTCLNGAGYDLRVGMDVTLPPGKHQLVATLEKLELPADLAGTLHIRSSLARAGIMGSLSLVDPGFRGQLTISLFNASNETHSMKKGDKFLQMVLHLLITKTARPYRGKYQDSQGIVETRRE
jgi:dCTP deaminase